ncbi:MAG: ABC transporter permease [Anaerolineales bacterium]|nr:ABC transporter permease [Anaerolineales bacterium]
MYRTLAVMRKEFIHIFRDSRTLAVMFLIPIIQLVLLGYAATTDVDHISTVVFDQDRTAQSRELIDTYGASGYFDINYYVSNEEALARLIDGGKARAGLLIPAGYSKDLAREGTAQVSVVIDGSDPSIANAALSAATAVGQAKSAEIVQQMMGIDPEEQPGLEVRPRVWYNPELASANFMIPGIIGTIMQLLTTFLTSMAIVRERERGTMEQLIVTPLKSYELIIGKLIPYVFIAFLDTLEVLAVGAFWFGVPIRGSILLLLALSVLALMTSLGLGLFISTVSNTQQEAMLLSYLIQLPSIFLSGFMFPIAAMPRVLQYFSYGVPLTYFLIIVRGIVLKGIGLELLIEQVVAMAIFGVVILTLSAARFRKRLE